MKTSKLTKFFDQVGGRFVTLFIEKGKKTSSFCAKIEKVTPKTVVFKDVNSSIGGITKVAQIKDISLLKCGELTLSR